MSDAIERNIVERVLHYKPTVPAAVVSGILFALTCIGLSYQLGRYRNWWGLCLPIGSLAYATGFFLRIVIRDNPSSLGLFIAMQMFLLCSPAAFLAFNYIIYGRLIRLRIGDKYSPIRPAIVANVFVISDVVTFLVQGGGGGLQAQAGSQKLGATIVLVGLILQTLSYFVFTGLVVFAHWKIKKLKEYSGIEDWWQVIWLLYFSSACIWTRGVYRVIELAQGDGGYLLTHEVYFYALDTLPLFVAIAPYVYWWPGSYFYRKGALELHESAYILGRRAEDARLRDGPGI